MEKEGKMLINKEQNQVYMIPTGIQRFCELLFLL